MSRPCDDGKKCKYDVYDYSENTNVCAIDYDGTNCPYIKPYGKRKYEEEHKKRGVKG